MNASIIADGKELKLNRFISELTASILDAVARSLKFSDGRVVEFHMHVDDVKMFVDGTEVPLNLGSASRIVRDVLQGLSKNLYGAENAADMILICERTP